MKTKKMMIALLATMSILGGCSNTTPASQTESDELVKEINELVEITFWHGMTGAQQETLQSLTDSFMKENPNIKVNLQAQGAYSDLQQKLTAAQASPKDLPTITQAYPGWMLNAINEGYVQDLSVYIEDETIGIADVEDILPALREATKINGKTYALPFNKSTDVLWYNKTLLDELGLTVPTNLDELAEVSKTIYEKTGIVGAGFDALQNFYVTYLKERGVDFDSSFDPTCQESIDAANYYLDGIKGGYFRIAGSDKYHSGPFSSENVAMYVGSSAGESFVKQGAEGKFEYGVARYPSKISIQQGTDIFMFSNATSQQKTAAFMYMKYLTNKDSQITWAVNTGYLPIRSTAINDDAYKNSGSAMAAIVADATKDTFTMKVEQGSDSASNEIKSVLEGILANKDSDVEKAMEAFKTTLATSIYE